MKKFLTLVAAVAAIMMSTSCDPEFWQLVDDVVAIQKLEGTWEIEKIWMAEIDKNGKPNDPKEFVNDPGMSFMTFTPDGELYTYNRDIKDASGKLTDGVGFDTYYVKNNELRIGVYEAGVTSEIQFKGSDQMLMTVFDENLKMKIEATFRKSDFTYDADQLAKELIVGTFRASETSNQPLRKKDLGWELAGSALRNTYELGQKVKAYDFKKDGTCDAGTAVGYDFTRGESAGMELKGHMLRLENKLYKIVSVDVWGLELEQLEIDSEESASLFRYGFDRFNLDQTQKSVF